MTLLIAFFLSCSLWISAGNVVNYLQIEPNLITDSQAISTFSFVQDSTFTNPGTHVSSCGSYNVVGGPGICGPGAYISYSVTVNSLPPHCTMQSNLYIVKYTNFVWGSISDLLIYIDGVQVYSLLQFNPTFSAAPACGTAEFYNNYPSSSHNADSVTWQFTQIVDPLITDNYWGTYGFSIYLDLCNNSTCRRCLSANTNCVECDPNGFLNGNIGCECNVGFYMVGYQCLGCDSSCRTCSGSTSNQCLTCPIHFVLILISGSNGYCAPCDSTCETCFGVSANECQTCTGLRYFYKNYCVTICPDTTVANLISHNCDSCMQGCKSCTLIALNLCATCLNNYFMSSGTCLPCDKTCKTCSNSYNDNCLSCFANAVLSQGYCICASGFYCIGSDCSYNCWSCDFTCLTCDNKGNCLSCVNSNYFSLQNVCVMQCPPPYFSDYINKQCYVCDSSCLTCKGGNVNDCLSCYQNFVLQNGVCQTNCSNGNYLEINTQTCLKPKIITITYSVVQKNYVYDIIFGNQWQYLFENINSILSIKIDNLNSNEFSTIIVNKSTTDSYKFTLSLLYHVSYIPKNTTLTLSFQSYPQDPSIILENTTFSDILNGSCSISQYNDSSKFLLYYDHS